MKGYGRIARRYLVSGRVQGVGFRYFVEREAHRIGLRGWVRNLDDGTVEVRVEGIAAQVTELEGLLWIGPRFSEVRSIEVMETYPSRLEGFRIR